MSNHGKENFTTRSGYVLLVTLGLLVLSTTLLVAVGRAAASHALLARLEQNELQRHWSTISCRSVLLKGTEQILASHEQQEHRAVGSISADIQLGDESITLLLADEQAKANVNNLIEEFGMQGAEDRLRQSLTGTGLVNLIHLRPAFIDSDLPVTRPSVPQLIFGPGQIFASIDPEKLLGSRPGVPAAMRSLTCWGSGSVNLMRADQTAMRLSLNLTQLEITRLIAARDVVMSVPITSQLKIQPAPGPGSDAIGALLQQAQIDPGRRNSLSLTTRSTCYSLSITIRDGRRLWYSMSISDESNPKQPVIQSLVW